MKTILSRVGSPILAAYIILAALFAAIPADAANQTLRKTTSATATGVYVSANAHGIQVIANAASLASAGADTAVTVPIDLYQPIPTELGANQSIGHEHFVTSSGGFARQLVIYGTAAASVDSARVQYEWSHSESGPWMSDQTFANTGNNPVLKLNNAAGTNLLTAKSYVSAIPARYFRLKYVNGDATTAGIVRLVLQFVVPKKKT
jgi:hypothetical protein